MRFFLLVILFAGALHAGEFRVGVGVVDITPKLCKGRSEQSILSQYDSVKNCFRWIHLAGFSPYYTALHKDRRLAEGVHDPIWSRALALQGSNGERLLMISTDLPGLTWKHINPIRRRISKMFGIPVSNIIIHSTHSHAAPDAAGYWSTLMWMHNKSYTDLLREWIYLSAREAFFNLTPARMKIVTTTHFSCFDPETLELKKDPDCRLPDFEFQFAKPEGQHYDELLIQRDERDPFVRNTRIIAAQFIDRFNSGKTIATFVNWHNHPDTMGDENHLVSSDYVHYLREYIEKVLGGKAVYFVGTLGNQIGGMRGTAVPLWNEKFERVYQPGVFDPKGRPVPVLVREGWEKIRGTGYEVASEAVTALKKVEATDKVDIKIQTEVLDNQVDNFIHNLMTGSVWNFDVDPEDRMRKYLLECFGLLGCVRSDVSVVQIGDLGFVTAPGEIDPAYFYGRKKTVADYGGKWGEWTFPAMPGLEPHIPGKHKTMIGSANNYLSYLVPASDNVGPLNSDHPNHYEEFVTIGKHFGDDTGNKQMQMLGAKERYSSRAILPRAQRTNP
jgi:hypothetical protein